MATGTTALTELDAVNEMLAAIFEAPVNTLEVVGIEDVAIAKRYLSAAVRAVLLKGLANNTERNVTLSVDGTGKIPLPANVLRVDVEEYEDVDAVQRGSYLYDRENHTFTFTRPLCCAIVYNLEWLDLPEHIKEAVKVLAARRLQRQVLGDAEKGVFDQQAEMDARATLGEADTEIEDSNMNTDSWSVLGMLDR
jgi:hypothetical protein